MGYERVVSMNFDKTIGMGGVDKKTGKPRPTRIEGFYLGKTSVTIKDKPTTVYGFLTPEGTVGVYEKEGLRREMLGAKVGLMTLVVQEGMRPTNHQPMYIFEVSQDKTRSIDVNSSETSSPNSEFEDGDASEELLLDESSEEAQEEVHTAPRPPVRTAVTPSAESQAKIRAALAARSAAAKR